MHGKSLATLLLLTALITVPAGTVRAISIYDHIMIGWLTNIRLAAFGGAGIALTPQEGVTALKVNPAATIEVRCGRKMSARHMPCNRRNLPCSMAARTTARKVMTGT